MNLKLCHFDHVEAAILIIVAGSLIIVEFDSKIALMVTKNGILTENLMSREVSLRIFYKVVFSDDTCC